MEPLPLFRTLHGSRLYGLHHAASDYDWFEVYDRLPGCHQANQRIQRGNDTVKAGLSRFMQMAADCARQALEAMFAPTTQWQST